MEKRTEAFRLLLVLLISVFVIEIAIMAGLHAIAIENVYLEALVDASILVVFLFPVLYFLAFKKLVVKNDALMSAEGQLRGAHAELEERVEERTQELVTANECLGTSLAQLEVKRGEIEILGDMAKMFQACTDFDEAIKVAEYELQRLFPEHVGALYIMKESRNQLDRAMAWGESAEFVESFSPEDCWSLRFGRPHHFHFGERRVSCSHVEAGREGDEHLCLPIVAYGETLGILCLQRNIGKVESAGDEAVPSAERLQFCATVTESLALAIANLRLRETLRHQALRDPLTGLFNRRYLTDSLERELERAESLDQNLSVIMFDIDFFKRFNDEFGHDSGDAVLSSLGAILKKHTRATDIVARYGGEEFALVMSDADADFAHERVDALRQEIAAMAVKHNGRSLGSVSISAGISVYPRDGDNPDDLFKVADTALYEAKRAGRDRVFVAGRIPAGDEDDAPTLGSVDTAA